MKNTLNCQSSSHPPFIMIHVVQAIDGSAHCAYICTCMLTFDYKTLHKRSHLFCFPAWWLKCEQHFRASVDNEMDKSLPVSLRYNMGIIKLCIALMVIVSVEKIVVWSALNAQRHIKANLHQLPIWKLLCQRVLLLGQASSTLLRVNSLGWIHSLGLCSF